MPEIRLEHVTKHWGKFYAVDDLDLVIQDNAFVTLLGPSGCGKTTTLRMIAGLETPTSGRITIGDKVVFDSALGINIPANKRKVGFLFQNYALWPNMTVYQNISFGLSNIKEEMPEYNFEAKNAARLAEILSRPEDVVKVLEECRDKKGKLDEKKAIIKLIDAFTISQYTAKKLFGYHLEQGKDLSGEIKALKDKVAAAEAAGMTEDFQIVKDGKPAVSVRKLTKEEIDLSVRRVSRIVKISMFMDRYPAELSGGQQQRVAIARTLAPEPLVLFMDEPLSNLDAKLRGATRREILLLHKRLGATMLYVTHDQTEALTLADRIVCMSMGHVQQVGTPLELYDSPANLFVASFIGLPPMNFFEVTVAGDMLQGRDFQVPLTAEERERLAGYQGKEIILGVRPENISEGGSLPVQVFSNENLGMNTLVHGHLGTARITAKLRGWKDYKEGDTVPVRFDRKHFFDKETTNAIGRERKA